MKLYQEQTTNEDELVITIVGAGGIGYELQSAFRMFEYPKVSAIIKPGKPIISMPLEDMSPLLKIEELRDSMLRNLSPKSKSARKF